MTIPGAGISLDLDFNHNVVSNAVLTANDLGIFMRASRDNQFYNVSIRKQPPLRRVHGAGRAVDRRRGWEPAPRTECAQNSFTNLAARDCGGAAFRVNNTSCTNNVIVRAEFDGNRPGRTFAGRPDLVTVR